MVNIATVKLFSALGPVESMPANPRTIAPEAMERLKASIQRDPEFMRLRPIVVGADGIVIGGNQRLRACAELGIDPLPDGWVVRADSLTDEQRRRFILVDNAPEGMSGAWDFERLAADWDLSELGELGFEELLAELKDVMPTEPVDAEPQVDRAEELRKEWGVNTGDMWALGDNRLLCGDSTNAEDVARCLGGVVPLLMVTDPPYGVEYDPGWRAKAGVNKNTGKMGKVANDDVADWSPAWRLFPGDAVYVYHAGVMSSTVQSSLEICGFKIRAQIIWAKDRMALSRGDYHWQHEPCWYAVREGKPGHRTDDRTQTTLWNIPARDDSGHGHGTQKPVECMARPIRNHESEYVYEPFSGSGTTIIACEQLGRKCLAIEISPGYVAVALQRWADATGKKAERISDGSTPSAHQKGDSNG